jgi:DNA polymerase I-like protein with 3'-5' exonuclease and polymerase domains
LLVNVDVKSLEIVVAAYLSQDPVLMRELENGVDFHEDNRVKFKLPTRLIAKVLGFRILYGGTEHSFARDPDFTCVSSSKDYWKRAIEAYYDKYRGIKSWHTTLVQQATTTGKIVSPTGRVYYYQPKESAWGMEWPVTTIKNYIVQGMGADLVMIARISLYNRLKKLGLNSKLVATVHDSIVIDCPENEWEAVAALSLQCVRDVPMNFERLYKVPFNLSLNAEVLYGPTLGKMEEWK